MNNSKKHQDIDIQTGELIPYPKAKKNVSVRDIVLNLEEENRIEYNINHRGGQYGARAEVVVSALFPTLKDEGVGTSYSTLIALMPRMFGAYVNYLGGGLRGAICRSDYDKRIRVKYAKRLDSFTRECARRYEELENGAGLNNAEDADGETNWDAIGSARCRAAGVKSAY